MRLAGLLRLVRASIALSPMADAAAGAALAVAAGASADAGSVAAAVLASLGLFLYGMAQNDFADREKDARLGRGRPIPAGEVSPTAALAVVVVSAAGALALAAVTTTAALALAASIIASIAVYNLAPAHAGPVGPLLLGAVRAQNLTLGAAALGAPSAALPAAGAYLVYVTSVSYAARMEDGEVAFSSRALRRWLAVAQLAALAAPVVTALTVPGRVPPAASGAAIAVGAGLAVWIERSWRGARAAGFDAPPTIPRLIGAALSGVFLFDASVACAAGAWRAALVLVLLFPVSRALVRRFPPS